MRIVAWILIGLAAFSACWAVASFFFAFDPKGSGSIVFLAFLFGIVGWLIGDF